MTRRTLGTLLIGFIFGFAVTLMLLAAYTEYESNQPDWYTQPVVAEPDDFNSANVNVLPEAVE